MSSKSPYEILGVPIGSSKEDIRKAYMLRVRMIHPDKFDQVTQKAEWNLANEMLKELNNAYNEIKDGNYRQNVRPSSSASSNTQSSRAPGPDINLGRLKAGSGWYANFPKSVQQQLKRRVKEEESMQYAVPLESLVKNYIFLIVLFGWLAILVMNADSNYGWNGEHRNWLLSLTILTGALQSWNIAHMLKWWRSDIKPMLIITPLYVIKTSLDKVQYWPIWTITALNATHHYKNSSYTHTSVVMEFGKERQVFNLYTQPAYDIMRGFINRFVNTFNSAKNKGDWNYLKTEDDFFEVKSDQNGPEPKGSKRVAWRVTAITSAIYILAFLGSYAYNYRKSNDFSASQNSKTYASPAARVPEPTPSPQTYIPPKPAPEPKYNPPTQIYTQSQIEEMFRKAEPTINYPECALPLNGIYSLETRNECIARFVVNASQYDNYYIKLEDTATKQIALTLFVRAGSTTEVKVPVGNYIVKYASGTKWYGTDHLFGPNTSYNKADTIFDFFIEGNQIVGNSVTLYKVKNGNLETKSIPKEEF